MSSFIAKSDYAEHINNNVLDAITQTTDSKLDEAETRAIELMKGYLSARYLVDEIFNKTGSNRNPVIVMYAIDLALYFIHSLINFRKIPDYRKERYNAAVEWLEKVNAGEINPPGLPVPDTGDKDYILYGSNTKRDNHI